jgi:hypothetical protein
VSDAAGRRLLVAPVAALVAALAGACSTHGSAATRPRLAPDTVLRAELLRRVTADQAIREQFDIALRDGRPSDSALVARMSAVDAENTGWIGEIVARRGWPGRSAVGADGEDAAFTLVQHADADTALQARVLQMLERAYHAGEATGQQLALLTDRVATARGAPQEYGTQVKLVGGRAVLKPVRDSANVDARRASVGLPPLREYLRMIDSAYAPRAQHPTP